MDLTVYSDTNAHYLGFDASTDVLTFIGTTFALTAAFNIVGAVGITGALSCSGDFTVHTDDFVVDVDGNITMAPTGGTAAVTGILTVTSDFKVNTDDFVVDADGDITMAPTGGDVDITGTLSASGNFDVNSTKFVVTAATGDLSSYNQEADATGVTWTAKKSRAAAAACVDNDVALTIVAQGMNDNATPALHDLASIDFVMTDSGDASEDGKLSFKTVVAGVALAEKLSIADVITASAGINVGVDDTGYDVKFFGATTGKYMLWGQADDKLSVLGNVDIFPFRTAGDYAYGLTVDGAELFFTGGAGTKSNLVDIQGERPVGTTPTGDSYDAVLKIAGTNYTDSAAYIMRGLNGKVSNGSGGSLALIEHNLSANNKSGGTALTVRAMTLTAENYGTCATEFGGLDIVLKNEAAVATTEYGLRIRNANNSIADAVAAAVLVSDSGANTGWDYVLDDNGASVVVADARLHNAATLNNSAAGSIDVALGTLAGATADDGLAITVTDSTTFASGFANMLHLIGTNSGNKTGGTAVSQWNGIAADLTVGATGNVNGGYIYLGLSGTPDLSAYTVAGWNVDIQELGATDYLADLWLQKTNTTKGTSVDSFILCSLQGAGVAKSALHFQGIALPDNFLTIPGGLRDMLVTGTPTGSTKAYLKVDLNGVAYGIEVNSVA
jgi:hypothetical protein